jgi:Holliday junction resolvase RusA-like endonuclease
MSVIRLNSRHGTQKRRRWSPLGPRGRASHNDIINVNPKAKQIAHFHLAILKMCNEEIIKNPRSKTKAIEEFVQLYNSGLIQPEILSKPDHISRATFYNWSEAYKDGGFTALIPRWIYKKKPGADLTFMKLLPTYTKIIILGNPRTRGKREFLPQLRRQWQALPLDGPIMISLFFSMPVPKGTKMRRRMKMLKYQISHSQNPNLDRLIAFTLDCMKGIVFRDHSQIIRFHSEKNFGWDPKTRIFVRGLSR